MTATQAVKRFYGAAYADNKPDVPTRQTVAEEPSRGAVTAMPLLNEVSLRMEA